MEVKLVVCSGKSVGKTIAVSAAKFLIGRSEDCHLRPQSDLVSRHHCAILVDEGSASIRDLGSRNGTQVNGERIRSEVELKPGDRVKVGPLEFDVQIGVEVGGKKKPKVQSVQEAAARTVAGAKRSADEEPDISDWMDDEDETPPEKNAADTKTIDFTPTQTNIPVPEKRPDPKQEDPQKPKLVGKFSDSSQKPLAESSRKAAADMLQKMLKHRR
ncbi:MAG: FHA domain-containing protein [Planctomycetota bacterium]